MRPLEIRDWPVSTRAAAALLAAALVLDLGTLVHAQRLRSSQPVPLPLIQMAQPILIQTRADVEAVHVAASRTPFDLMAPAPAMVATNAPIQTPPAQSAAPRLIGTVVQPQGSFVVLELPDARMQVVRIGERAADLRLRSVTVGAAVFDDPHGNRVSLRTPQPGAESRP